MSSESQKVAGGGFLLNPCGSLPTFIPENLNEEMKELARMTGEFSMREALAITDRIEDSEPGVVPALLKKAGSLGLLMAEIPETFGGLGLSKVAATVIAENMTYQSSFSVTFTCHTGIGTLPLLYYGTDAQKAKYLTKLATGEMIGAYSLTESEAGSDALSVRTKAVLSPDKKHYILNGEKVYCTNGGIADIFTVFAKVDGEKFTAFLIEKGTEGFTIGHEEGKMGIHGSSTTSIILNDVKVPVENILGEIGRGHKIAFNTLNVGRFKLGAACMGTIKRMLENAAPQANTRKQFGKPIGSFELIRQKIARMVCASYILESLVYRYAGDLDELINALDKNAPDHFDKVHNAMEELAVEAAIAKVYGSEALSFAADEAVQIFGGAGFIKGYIVEQEYRDSRVNRIFEGTNEICRLIIPTTLVKRAMAGKLKLMEALSAILAGLKTGYPQTGDVLIDQVEAIKRLAIYVAGVALQKFGESIKDKQSVIETMANTMIETYAFDSSVSRLVQIEKTGEKEKGGYIRMLCEAAIAERVPVMIARARQTLINIAGANSAEYEPYLKALSRLISPPVSDTDALYDKIAARALEKENYPI